MPTLAQRIATQHKRAILIDSNSNAFGNECLRLVNISFHTSQTFPLMMNTCSEISQYLREELMQQYPIEYLHIIIGENHVFAFAISDGDYFAEIEQEQYRVLIFTTNRRKNIRYNVDDANNQMVLTWKSSSVTPLKK